jgi:hypothetical protein
MPGQILERLRLTIGENPAPRLPRRTPYRFIMGLPLEWAAACGRLPGRALHVGVCLWHLAGLNKTHSVVCSYGLLRKFGVKRHAAYRALKVLEEAGLIKVVRGRGQSPRVMLQQICELRESKIHV